MAGRRSASDLHRAKHALERDVERVGGRLQLDRLVSETERRDILLVDQERRWSHSAEQEPSLFLPDGSPADLMERPAGQNRSWTADEQATRRTFHAAADRLFV